MFVDYLERAAKELPAENLIFGSDGPLVDTRVELYRIKLLQLAAAKEALVLGGNILPCSNSERLSVLPYHAATAHVGCARARDSGRRRAWTIEARLRTRRCASARADGAIRDRCCVRIPGGDSARTLPLVLAAGNRVGSRHRPEWPP